MTTNSNCPPSPRQTNDFFSVFIAREIMAWLFFNSFFLMYILLSTFFSRYNFSYCSSRPSLFSGVCLLLQTLDILNACVSMWVCARDCLFANFSYLIVICHCLTDEFFTHTNFVILSLIILIKYCVSVCDCVFMCVCVCFLILVWHVSKLRVIFKFNKLTLCFPYRWKSFLQLFNCVDTHVCACVPKSVSVWGFICQIIEF